MFRRLLSRLALPALLLAAASPARAQVAAEEIAARRGALVAALPADALVIAFGERSPIGFPAFYQVPAFRYLTGYLEPNAALVLTRGAGGANGLLFRESRSARDVITDGPAEDSTALAARTGLAVRPLAAFVATVDSLIAEGRPVYLLRDVRPYGFTRDSLTRGAAFAAALRRRTPAPVVRDADAMLDSLRAQKSVAERALVQRAAEITSEAVREAIAGIRPGMREYEVQARIEFGFRSRGADRPSFATNVSAGDNATIVHHRAADDALAAGTLVLMDVGAAWRGYAADVTRTVPVSGRFTTEQRAIYQLVRDAQSAAERQIRVGAPTRTMDDSARAVIAAGLARLGLIDSATATFDPPWGANCATNPAPCRQSYLFYSHGLGHGIGLEVHDPAHLRAAGGSRFAVGDAFTIEPGIYISRRRLDLLPDTPRNRAFVARVRAAVDRYDGIGVRIEDDYLLDERGPRRISTVVREANEIEALMRRR